MPKLNTPVSGPLRNMKLEMLQDVSEYLGLPTMNGRKLLTVKDLREGIQTYLNTEEGKNRTSDDQLVQGLVVYRKQSNTKGGSGASGKYGKSALKQSADDAAEKSDANASKRLTGAQKQLILSKKTVDPKPSFMPLNQGRRETRAASQAASAAAKPLVSYALTSASDDEADPSGGPNKPSHAEGSDSGPGTSPAPSESGHGTAGDGERMETETDGDGHDDGGVPGMTQELEAASLSKSRPATPNQEPSGTPPTDNATGAVPSTPSTPIVTIRVVDYHNQAAEAVPLLTKATTTSVQYDHSGKPYFAITKNLPKMIRNSSPIKSGGGKILRASVKEGTLPFKVGDVEEIVKGKFHNYMEMDKLSRLPLQEADGEFVGVLYWEKEKTDGTAKADNNGGTPTPDQPEATQRTGSTGNQKKAAEATPENTPLLKLLSFLLDARPDKERRAWPRVNSAIQAIEQVVIIREALRRAEIWQRPKVAGYRVAEGEMWCTEITGHPVDPILQDLSIYQHKDGSGLVFAEEFHPLSGTEFTKNDIYRALWIGISQASKYQGLFPVSRIKKTPEIEGLFNLESFYENRGETRFEEMSMTDFFAEWDKLEEKAKKKSGKAKEQAHKAKRKEKDSEDSREASGSGSNKKRQRRLTSSEIDADSDE